MIKIKKIGVLSLGKIFGILYAIMGLIGGAFISLVVVSGLLPTSSFSGLIGALVGVGSIVILPIFYGIAGFISGVIMALLYNLVASWVGGLEVETE
jgi:hypothetical protein